MVRLQITIILTKHNLNISNYNHEVENNSIEARVGMYRRFLIHTRDSLSLVIPNNKTLEHWRL